MLILSQYYDPEPIPKPAELAQELKRRGHTVSVITGFPHYPAGALYPGFRLSLFQKEEREGIPVLRTFEFPCRGRSSVGRVLNYTSFMFSSLLGAFLTPRCDVIYVWHPPLTIGIAALIISYLKRAPFVYDVQDIWPESILSSGWKLPVFAVRILHWMERIIYRRAERVLVVTTGAKDNLHGKGVPSSKLLVAPHWFDVGVFQSENRRDRDIRSQYNIKDRFVVMFAGNLGLMQGLDTLIHTADKLHSYKEILFVLVGDGVDRDRLRSMVSELGLDNILFVEKQPMSEMPSYLSSADALLVLLRDSKLSECIIPTKTFAYMAAGKPVVAAVNGACADLIRDAKAGFAVSPGCGCTLAEGVLRMYKTSDTSRRIMGENGRRYLLSHFSRDKVIGDYERILLSAGAVRV
ncbi:glycosyltransferase family 4 protein [Acidobacteria bacterium AH-259-O06]|nr:glycosyltransferase family 4 protein [Acidobacteria bacterium AH-259-O06]